MKMGYWRGHIKYVKYLLLKSMPSYS